MKVGRVGLLLSMIGVAACVAPPSKGRPSVGGRPPLRAAAAPPGTVKPAPPPGATKSGAADAAVAPVGPVSPPVILSSLPSPADYNLLANGGWNANWYVGHNTCWVVKLPPVPAGGAERAFLGAKLGGMKTEPVPGRPAWERRPISGEIDIAVSPQPLWPQNRRFYLAAAADIPLAGDGENALEGVGEARWFWVEVPPRALSSTGPNYVALFSPSENLRDESHAPILAAGPAAAEDNAWLNTAVSGGPPLTAEEALKTPVASYEPAVAVKWVAARSSGPKVTLKNVPERRSKLTAPRALEATVEGPDIDSAWLEIATDGLSWKRVGAPLRGAPYTFTLWPNRLPEGLIQVRIAAKDQWESRGVSGAVSLRVVRPPSDVAP